MSSPSTLPFESPEPQHGSLLNVACPARTHEQEHVSPITSSPERFPESVSPAPVTRAGTGCPGHQATIAHQDVLLSTTNPGITTAPTEDDDSQKTRLCSFLYGFLNHLRIRGFMNPGSPERRKCQLGVWSILESNVAVEDLWMVPIPVLVDIGMSEACANVLVEFLTISAAWNGPDVEPGVEHVVKAIVRGCPSARICEKSAEWLRLIMDD